MEDTDEATTAMEVDEERKAEPTTVLIDTTEKSLVAQAALKAGAELKKAQEKKRSASLKLALMLIGTMRLVSKPFRVHLLKGLLLQDEYFRSKGASVIEKQAMLAKKQGLEL